MLLLREDDTKWDRFFGNQVSIQHDPHSWWIYDPRETSGKTCPTCLGLIGTHYRGDEVEFAFPYHVHLRANTIRAKVHPHCRCRLIWTGRTKTVNENPYGILKRPAQKAELPSKVAGKIIDLSPSQKRLYDRTSGYARETFRKRNR